MAKVYDEIDPALASWIAQQHMFFVSTAPLSEFGAINCSPKGGDTFRVIGGSEVAYLDFTGSGVETIAHLRENGRIVIMFCAFEGPPRIVRLHGRGHVMTAEHAGFRDWVDRFPPNLGTRAIIRVKVDRVSDSCGYAVPRLDFQAPRDSLDKWARKKGPDGLVEYRRAHNARSIDGLPGLDADS